MSDDPAGAAGKETLARLLAECTTIEKTGRAELAKRYAAMTKIDGGRAELLMKVWSQVTAAGFHNVIELSDGRVLEVHPDEFQVDHEEDEVTRTFEFRSPAGERYPSNYRFTLTLELTDT
jgi:hypothetical protein